MRDKKLFCLVKKKSERIENVIYISLLLCPYLYIYIYIGKT